MNKTYFIDEVKRLVNEKTADELRKAVLKIARFIERGAREDVLEILNQQKLTLDVTEAFDLLAEVEKLLREVEEGQYEVGWGEYGVYDYYSDDDTLYDPNGLNGRLEDLLKLSIDYVKQKRYEEAYKAFEGLCAICIPNEDYDDITLSNFSDEWDMSLTEKDVYKFYACTVLVVLKDEERLDKLYEILSEVYFGINIADIAAIVNDEIPERSVFGRQWIDYLMDCELHQREHVLIEAVLFDGGLQGLHTFAKAHGVKYKSAYLTLVEGYLEGKEYTLAVSAGREALAALPEESNARVKIADMVLEAGKKLNDNAVIREAIWEGFVSARDLRHFILLYKLKDDELTERAVLHLGKNEGKANNEFILIHCLLGNFDYAYKIIKESGDALRFIPVFIALLSGGEQVQPCTKKLINASIPTAVNTYDFIKILLENISAVPKADLQTYYDWCKAKIDASTESIVRGQQRAEYNYAASLIVAMAECIYSEGKEDVASRHILNYKLKYPNHTAFRRELRAECNESHWSNLV